MRRSAILEAAPYLIALAVLLAASGKAFHIDDGVFLSYAREARAHPLQPYLAAGPSNPPGNVWLLAALTGLFGETERALHLALLPFALLALASSRWLAALFGVRAPWAVPLLLSCSACVLLPATTLMPDVTMLAFLVPAIALVWSDAKEPRAWKVAAACALFATGWTLRISGAPVLALAALVQLSRRNLRALWPLASLVLAFIGWSLVSRAQTGTAQTVDTARLHGSFGFFFFVARTVSTAGAYALTSTLAAAALLLLPRARPLRAVELTGFGLMLLAPFVPLANAALVAGALLFFAARLRWRALDRDDVFLWLWVAGGLAVPVLYNQAAAKYLDLLVVPAAILLLRAVGDPPPRRLALACAFGLVVAIPLAIADQRHAEALKQLTLGQVAAAKRDGAPHVFVAGTPWGAYEYALPGATFTVSTLKPGTPQAQALVPGDQVLDLSYPGALALPKDAVQLLAEGDLPDDFPLRTMGDGAGFWSSQWGILPFVFSREPLQPWWRVRIARPIR